MKLCIAEKPSVAKDIAQILGATQRNDGFWEGNGYWVSWTFGHLCTLKEPADYSPEWKQWNLDVIPMIPESFGIKLIENGGVRKQFDTIASLVDQCEEIINCGDAGQEGELIQRWVLSKAKNKKPIKRLWISSLTEEAIKEGFENLKDGKDYDNLYAAGTARAVGDWLLGMNASRLYTLKFGARKQVFSVGRVQTPTLALIVNRQKAIDSFKPETYYEIKTTYREVEFSGTKGKIKTKDAGEFSLESIKDSDFEVVSYTQKEGKETAPSLFDLTSLQVEGNKKFGFSAEETLNHVQNLYESKLVTYPRVDTTYLPNDQYPKIAGILQKLNAYSKYTEKILGKKIRKTSKVFNDKKVTDHHAIIPTGEDPSKVGLSLPQKKIYDLITRRFIAVFYPDCKVSNTTVLGKVEQVDFRASGKQILEPGWRELYASQKTDSSTSAKATGNTRKKEDEQVMPVFEKGEKGPHKPELLEKQTKAPSYFTEATLLRAMETAGKQVDDDELRELMKENGIGRPSTRANIIEKLFSRKYLVRQKKRILATSIGKELIDHIENDLLKSAELTGVWEKKIRDIEFGNYDVKQFKEELNEMVRELTTQVKSQGYKQRKTTCPKCQVGHLIRGKQAWGCSDWKNGCKFILPYEFKGITINDNEMKELLENGITKYGYISNKRKPKDLKRITLSEKFKLAFESKK
ncbi:MAG: DNA topoisomerase III [Crocinitomicaceae bacterium]|nr:DNA topoisomerase III [Crocinitomicaceae bacterium]|tara:strand:+ start:10313 stop:12382 length:2070 start_codon:yes stop_codon:yes gene_type:complete